MTISFNQIPINILTPGQYVEFDNSKAVQGLVAQPQKILILGQKTSSGTADENTPYVITQEGESISLFGQNSMVHAMFMALRAINNVTQCTVIGLADDVAGTAATGTITIAGTPTLGATLNVYIAGERVRVGVATTDTATDIATNLSAAINATPALPVSATSAAGVVTLEAVHAGTLGNDIDVRLNYFNGEYTPDGLTVTIAAMASGAGDPDIASALAATGAVQYNHIVMPYTDSSNMLAMETALTDRWGPMTQNEGHCYNAIRGTIGGLATWASSRNSPHITTMAFEPAGTPTPLWVCAAVYGGVGSYFGAIDPARPLQTLQMTGILPAPEHIRWNRAERNLLLEDGLATHVVDAGGNVLVERAVTNYTLNAFNLTDPSYRDTETMLTLSYLRYSLRARIAQKFPRYKLGNDGGRYGAGQAIVTPSVIRAEVIALFLEWEEAALVENFAQFKKDLIVERNKVDVNRVDVLLPPDLVNQFRVFAAQIQFRL